jgi:hypothetical protein
MRDINEIINELNSHPEILSWNIISKDDIIEQVRESFSFDDPYEETIVPEDLEINGEDLTEEDWNIASFSISKFYDTVYSNCGSLYFHFDELSTSTKNRIKRAAKLKEILKEDWNDIINEDF